MAHKVEVNITSHPLSREESGVDFIVDSNEGKFEELRVSACRTTLSMADDALDRLMAGRTNLEELIRMLPYSSIYEFRQRGLGRLGAAPLVPAVA